MKTLHRLLGQVIQRVSENRDRYKIRKNDRVALNQLIQLDDALLSDIGITRRELELVQCGSQSFDALVKQKLQMNRDNMCNSSSLRN